MPSPFQTIFESVVEGVIVTNRDGQILLANPAAERLFGYAKNRLINRSVESLIPKKLGSIHASHRANYTKNPHTRRMGSGRDLIALKKDGTTFPIEVSLSHTKLDGEFAVIAFLIDITERKQAEKAVKKSEERLLVYAAELERRVGDRTRELANANKKLEEANIELQEEITIRKKAEEEARNAFIKEKELNELKSRFVSLASHEFRTPLSTILSSVSLIGKYTTSDTQDKRQKHIERIKNNVYSLTSLLNDFLNLEKLEEGQIKAQYEEFNLLPFMQEIHEETQLITKNGQNISLEHDPEISYVHLDKQMLKNICLNLISNAIKYSEEGQDILFRYRKEKNLLKIEIRDWGMGIPATEQAHLFQRFFRAKNVSGIQGTGLGLFIVKKYAEEMQGSVTFVSKHQKGSTFTIELPIRYDESTPY